MKKFFSNPWLIIIPILALTAGFGFMIPRIILDNEVKAYFPHNHPSYVRTEQINDTYGSQILMVVAIDAKGKTILTKDGIETIRKMTDELGALDGIERIQSMTNIDYIVGMDGGMSAEKLVPDGFAGTDAELADVKARIVDWERMYGKVVISDDFKGSQIIMSIKSDVTPDQMSALYAQTEKVIESNSSNAYTMRLAGDPVLSERAKEYMRIDLMGLIPFVVLIVLLCLFFSFKNIEGTILPLVTVVVSVVWTVGLMALTGAHFTVVSSCMPVLLIAVGSAYGIHVVNHYYEELKAYNGPITKETHRELIMTTLKNIAYPVFLAGLTTIVGFVSNLTSPIAPLITFSIYSGLGVMFALILSLTLIPALLMAKPNALIERQRAKLVAAAPSPKQSDDAWKETFIGQTYAYLNRHKARLVFAIVAIVAVSAWGFSRINIESSLIKYFPEDSQMRKDVAAIDSEFAGTNLFSFVVAGKEKGDLADPEILERMDGLSAYLTEKYPEIGKVVSFTDFIRRMNKVMHDASGETALATDASAGSPAGTSTAGAPDSFFSDSTASEPDSFFSDSSAPAAASAVPAAVAPVVVAPATDFNETLDVAGALDLFRKAYARAGGGDVSSGELLNALEVELNYRGAAYDEVPYDAAKYPVADRAELKNLVSQYLLLYSGSLDQFADDPLAPKEARMQIQLKTHDTGKVNAIIKDAKAWAAANFPEGYTLEAGGIAEMEVALTNMITGSQIVSIIISALAVFVILALYFKSPVAGLISTIPLALAILINFGIMGLTGINLDMVTSLIASLAVGIGVDYTIHFMSNYHRERLLSDDVDLVTMNTLKVSGKAIVINAVSVGLGFVVLCFSQFVVLRYIGFLVAVVMLTSSVAAMTVLPVLLNFFKPKFISRPLKGAAQN